MNNKRFGFRRLPMLFAAMIILSSILTSCEYFVNVDFNVANPANDTIDFIGWRDNTERRMTTPYTNLPGEEWETKMDHVTVFMLGTHGGPYVAIPEEQAFTLLISEYDSVRLTRRSDNASTITYHHNENATDAQRYFFTRDAWICDPEDETEKDRTYTLILTEDMFK